MTTTPALDRSALEQSALEQAALIRAGELSATELLDAYLQRIEQYNPRLHAFVEVFERRARAAARAIDRRGRARWPDPLPAFFGIPLGIKDTDPVRFAFNRAGSRAYRYLWVPFDAPQVRLLRAAGFVIVGKTATSELALLPVVEPDIHAPTVNPWNLERSAGGSSGGSAAAVAARLLPIAHAADGGGSIRIPAALCHLFGFKPSRGLTPNFYEAMDPYGLSVTGSLARTVEDCAAFLDALRGGAVYPAAPDSLQVQVAEPPRRPLRVRLWSRSAITDTDAEVAGAVDDVARRLVDMGHDVEPCKPLAGSIDEFLPLFQRLAARPPTLGDGSLQPVTRWLRQAGRKVSDAQAREACDLLTRRVDAWFGDADLCLSPTVGQVAPRVNAWTHLPPEEQFRAAAELGAFTASFNVSGQPAASVPVKLSRAGLPIGVMLTGRRGEDALVLQVCRALERELDWRSRRAPLADP